MMLAEKNGTITDDKEIADVMNNYFINLTKSLGLIGNLIHVSQPLESIIHIFGGYKSIQRIKLANIRDKEQIHFPGITKVEVKK